MKLTGKAKEDFEKWFNKGINEHDEQYHWYLSEFEKLHSSMQWGVYVDFFDSKGYLLFVRPLESGESYWRLELEEVRIKGFSGFSKSISESRKSALQKANELYNS